MKQFGLFALVFLAGLGTGWLFRGEQGGVSETTAPQLITSKPATANAGSTPEPSRSRGIASFAPEQTAAPGSYDALASFVEALKAQGVDAAVALYLQATRRSPERVASFRAEFDEYVAECLQRCPPEQFLELADVWLSTYYDDIPMLLSLARFQSMQAQPESAASTLQLAKTYALEGAEQRSVRQAIQSLAMETDTWFSREQRWVELLGFYEYLATLGISVKEFRLRQAQLHGALGEEALASRILRQLQADDPGTDPQWSAALQELMPQDPAPEALPAAAPASALPLERLRDHYLVDVEINDSNTLTLVIDTGASITTLSSDSFRKLPRYDFELLGSRMFNTANGLTRGDVYRASSFRIGTHRLEGLTVAVLPYRTDARNDGLLGMNVLRNFRFEIDQDRSALLLERR
ncbi:MAG: retropepsin-like aspartic protease [Pseudomonadota bacterium]